MANNKLGDLRRSSVVSTFAPGAVVDFRAGDAPVSAVVAGLEEWDRNFAPAGLTNPQVVYEARLQRKLGVDGFRLPPVSIDTSGGNHPDERALVAARFPQWLQCPRCDLIAPARQWANKPGYAYRYCAACTESNPGGQQVVVIPVRFVVACSAGHLSEFPWHTWVRHKPDCPALKGPNRKLKLTSERAGLGGLVLSCPVCKQRRSMEGLFKEDALGGIRCEARRPWLSVERDPHGCGPRDDGPDPELRVVQRGASNLYFPVTDSALNIPPWADELQQALGMYWKPILDAATPEDRRKFITLLTAGPLAEALKYLRITADRLADLVEERLGNLNAVEGEDLRLEEYRRLGSGIGSEQRNQKEFEIRNSRVPGVLARWVLSLVRATRLREVRALKGFTRIYPPEGGAAGVAPLSSATTNWLPAIEVRGEGIFLALNQHTLKEWETSADVVAHVQELRARYEKDWKARHGDRAIVLDITPRFVLLHTLAHALIRELTLECGYSTASLRERLYVGDPEQRMAGLLIYTATTDSDGTLGGLARQGTPDRFERVMINAVEAMRWCSSDPLCLQGEIGGIDMFSIAACHACCLAPETCCEHHNRFLDRTLLIGRPENPALGFFNGLS